MERLNAGEPEPYAPPDGIYCPFSGDGTCPGDCPSQQERACINGED